MLFDVTYKSADGKTGTICIGAEDFRTVCSTAWRVLDLMKVNVRILCIREHEGRLNGQKMETETDGRG